MHTSVYTIHTSVFSFTMCTATTVPCNSIKDCFNLEISRNNYPGILKINQGKIMEISGIFVWFIEDFCLLDKLGIVIIFQMDTRTFLDVGHVQRRQQQTPSLRAAIQMALPTSATMATPEIPTPY